MATGAQPSKNKATGSECPREVVREGGTNDIAFAILHAHRVMQNGNVRHEVQMRERARGIASRERGCEKSGLGRFVQLLAFPDIDTTVLAVCWLVRSCTRGLVVGCSLLLGLGCGGKTAYNQDSAESAGVDPDKAEAWPFTLEDRINMGPDNTLWFTISDAGQIGRVTQDGSIDAFTVSGERSHPRGLAAGPNDDVWFTVGDVIGLRSQIGRITATGDITLFDVTENSRPHSIALGADGKLWFTQQNWNGLGRIATDGTFEQINIRAFMHFNDIVSGPNAGLWLASRSDGVVRVSVDGVSTYFAALSGLDARTVVVGPEQKWWFTLPEAEAIATLTTQGELETISLPEGSDPFAIAVGPAAHLWISEPGPARLTQVSPEGELVQHPLPAPEASPGHLSLGPDGALWYIDVGQGKIGRYVP